MKRLLLITSLIGWVLLATAQNKTVNQAIENLLESTGENIGDDADIQEMLDDWETFQENPVNVNTATDKDLKRLHLLTEFQVNDLIAYRERTGIIYSLYELASVHGFTRDLLQKLEPFLSFDPGEESVARRRAGTQVLFRVTRSYNTVSPSDGLKYEGSQERYFVRMKHTSTRLEYGWVAEKDPGEAFFRKSNKQGFDYNSAFANFGIGKSDNRLYAGDYRVQFGQGLVAWQGFSMGKSEETTQVFRLAQGIRSYSSTDENQFFRGLAGDLKLRGFVFSPFLSFRKLDASVSTRDETHYFGALQTTGYHRTISEINGEDALKQIATGGHLSFRYQHWSFGATAVFTRFNAFMDRSDDPYNQFLPEGSSNLAGGFDWKGSFNRMFVFGEGAFSRNNGRALVSGTLINLSKNVEFSVVYRNINRTYFSFFANSFTESSRVNDEHALYWGFKIYVVPKFTIRAYADFFRFNWIKYTTAGPSSGTEFFVQMNYTPSGKSTCYLRFFQEDKELRAIEGIQKYNASQLINRIRLNYSHDINDQLSLRSRLEYSFYSKQGNEKGVLVFQDILYHPPLRNFSFNARLAFYSTDGYNSRMYAFENDLLYAFAIPALYDKGLRAYFNVQKKIGSRITCWLKLAATKQLIQDKEDISGLNPFKPEVRFQMRYSF